MARANATTVAAIIVFLVGACSNGKGSPSDDAAGGGGGVAGGGGGGAGGAGGGGTGGVGPVDASAETTATTDASDGGSDSGDAASVSDGGGACNMVSAAGAPVVTRPTIEGAAPPSPAAGGTIRTGTYFQTSSTFYHTVATCSRLSNGTTGTLIEAYDALTPTSGTMELASGATAGVVTSRISYSYTTSGAEITFVPVCRGDDTSAQPDAGGLAPNTAGYTATDTTLSLYFYLTAAAPDGGTSVCATVVTVFERQP